MADNAKDGALSDADAKKGRASKNIEEKVSGVSGTSEAMKKEVTSAEDGAVDVTSSNSAEVISTEAASAEVVSTEAASAEAAEKKTRKARKTAGGMKSKSAKVATRKSATAKADDVMNDEGSLEGFQEAVREQIENCKNELKVSLEQSIRQEFSLIVKKQLKVANRRRRAGAIVRDIIILILAATVGYFGWCLYDVRYFDWMGPQQEVAAPDVPSKQEVDEPEVVVKDTRWYVNNYGYLFEDLQLGLNADSVEAYYLYSDDRKVGEIKPAYLLGMAYNKVMPTAESSADTTARASVAAADLRTAFEGMFGAADYFEKVGFTHGCKKFTYARENDTFVTENGDCVLDSEREIIEEIDEMHEEGSVLYVLTTAAIYDASEASFYSFDNLFKPAVTNAEKTDLGKNQAVLNRYQYQFKKTGEKYHFSGVVKLK